MTQLTAYNPSRPAYVPDYASAPTREIPPDVREPTMPSLLGVACATYMLSVVTLSTASEETSWIPQLVGAALGLVWIVVGVVIKGQPLIWSRPITLFILFNAWCATGMLVTLDTDYFLNIYTTTLKVLVVTWITLQCVRTRKDFLVCCLFVSLASVIIMAVSKDTIMRAVEFTGQKMTKEARASGTLISNSNELGSFGVLVCVAACTCLFGYKTILLKLLSIVPIVVALYIVAASGSRTAMVGLGAAAASVYWYHFRQAARRTIGRKVFLIILAAGVIGGTTYFVVKSPFFFRLVDVFSSANAVQDEPRYQYFLRALQATADNPLFGLGLGGFALNRLGVSTEGQGHYSHSTISETLSCNGIPGFLLFFGGRLVFYILIRRARKLPLPAPDYGTVNLIMAYFWTLIIFDIVSVTFQHRMMWPLEGAACGYLWYLDRQYQRPAFEQSA